MQLGFVNFNTEEKKRISKMMQLLSEPGAIEELVLEGCVTTFPTPCFQAHRRFSIMPSTLPSCPLYTIMLPTAAGNSVVYVKWSDSS